VEHLLERVHQLRAATSPPRSNWKPASACSSGSGERILLRIVAGPSGVIPGGSHAMHYGQPCEVVRLVREFLKKGKAADRAA
jgi:pimeloyl-ACP methyl ester carboxylesterase